MPATTTPTTPTTLLEAVNQLLNAIRVASVMSLLTTDLNEDASAAKTALDNASRSVQGRGWSFNTEGRDGKPAIIDPAPDGTITLPSNTLKVKSSRCWTGTRLVQRGLRLYDPIKRTYNIGLPAEVVIVLGLPFEELPPAARLYVTGIAARLFCLPRLPVGATFSYTQETLDAALSEMEAAEIETTDEDLKQTSPHFAGWARR